MRVIYPLEEERLLKGKPSAWSTRWWVKPLDWMALAGMVLSMAGFSVMPLAFLIDKRVTSNSIVFSLAGIQVCVSLGCIWLFLNAGNHARVYAEQGVVIASNVAIRVGLFLGHGLLLMAFVIDAITK